MTTVIASLPKVELYCRLTDAMDRFQARELADARDLPERDEAALNNMLSFSDGAGFLRASHWQRGLLRGADDIQRLSYRTATRLIRHAVVHAEFAVPVSALPCEPEQAFEAIEDGVMEALEESDDAFFSWSLVLEFERGHDFQQGLDGLKVWHQVAGERLCGVALVGDEALPSTGFEAVVKEARGRQMSVAVQAGLTGRARKFQDVLGFEADRVLHGIGITRAEDVIVNLRARRVAFLVAPALESALGRVKSVSAHPIAAMQASGLFVTVASIAPGLLDRDLTGQLETLSKEQSWRLDALRNLMLRSVEAAFMRPRDRFIIARAVENWRHRPVLTGSSDDSGFGM